jgi:hypothetical protein
MAELEPSGTTEPLFSVKATVPAVTGWSSGASSTVATTVSASP